MRLTATQEAQANGNHNGDNVLDNPGMVNVGHIELVLVEVIGSKGIFTGVVVVHVDPSGVFLKRLKHKKCTQKLGASFLLKEKKEQKKRGASAPALT